MLNDYIHTYVWHSQPIVGYNRRPFWQYMANQSRPSNTWHTISTLLAGLLFITQISLSLLHMFAFCISDWNCLKCFGFAYTVACQINSWASSMAQQLISWSPFQSNIYPNEWFLFGLCWQCGAKRLNFTWPSAACRRQIMILNIGSVLI